MSNFYCQLIYRYSSNPPVSIIFVIFLIVMTLKKYIADSLGTANGYAYPSMSDDQLDIKIDYSKEFLSVVSLIDPGVTKVSG